MAEHLAQTVDIETPELVVVSYTIAGLGSRVYAAIIDLLVCFSLLLGTAFVLSAIEAKEKGTALGSPMSGAWATAILVLVQFVVMWGYYLLCEGLFDGRTLGKRLLGLRTVRDGGYSVGFSASAVRNLMRFVDLQPVFTYLVGIGSIAASRSGKRLGDMVAGTIVVRETMVRQPASVAVPAPGETPERGVARLSDEEFQLLTRWADRQRTLDARRREMLTSQVVGRLATTLDESGLARDAGGLIALQERERHARATGAADRGATGASRERYAIIATQSPRWIAFAAQLADAQRRGLGSLGESGVRAFVAEYRALSADLARLRTAARGKSNEELFYLGRLVAGAHNLLYRDRRSTLRELVRFVAIDVPTEVRRSFRPIALAAAFLFVPAIIAYTAVVRDPAVAGVFLPVSMLDRAESGVSRAKAGDGYIDDPQVFRPVLASQIIANNVQVTIATFAAGITAGLGTVFLLILNGTSLGGVFGLYAAKGIGSLLLAFVAPHGVLELSAICIAASGGLLIAAALLIPGARTRRRALAENSTRAMRLLTASTLMLLVAGSIEGMISPIPYWPLSLKLIVSAVTAVLMVVYLRGGVGSQQPAGLDLEVSVDDGRRHARGVNVDHGEPGGAHARERLLSLAD